MSRDNDSIVCDNQDNSYLWATIMFQMQGECELEANCKDIWHPIFDPSVLTTFIHGCRKLDEKEQGYCRGRIWIETSAMGGINKTTLCIAESIPPKYCRFFGEIHGKSGLMSEEDEVHLCKRVSSYRAIYLTCASITEAVSNNPRYIKSTVQSLIKLEISKLERKIVSEEG